MLTNLTNKIFGIHFENFQWRTSSDFSPCDTGSVAVITYAQGQTTVLIARDIDVNVTGF